ncbi:MAG: hypothetical protein ACPGQL_03860 [Thermoplasmatota archaeon]
MLERLVLRVDRRLLVASAGVAAALLLPLAALLVLGGLEGASDPAVMVERRDGGPLDLDGLPRVQLAAAQTTLPEPDGRLLVAYTVDRLQVIETPPDRVWAMPQADRTPVQLDGESIRPRATAARDLVPTDALLVHRDHVEGPVTRALLAQPPPADVVQRQDLVVTPRGVEGFASASIDGLQENGLLLALGSLPAVTLIAVAFADLEARQQARTVATLAALGKPRLGRRLVVLRAWLMLGLGAGLAAGAAAGLYFLGDDAFRPSPVPVLELLAAGALPSIAGVAVATWRVRRSVGDPHALLRAPPQDQEPPSWRFGPAWLQPIAMGTRAWPLILVAAMLFVVNVGFPLSAALVPAAVAGEDGEVVVGADAGLVLGGRASAALPEIMQHDPAVEEIVGEVVVATVITGEAVILRGGDWDALADYHDLELRSGEIPGEGEILLGQRLSDRLGVHAGDRLDVPAAHHAHVLSLRVVGTYDATGLLADEAIVDLATGQHLAGLTLEQVTVVRARPDSAALEAALDRRAPRLEVIDLHVSPEEPVPGALVTLGIDLVNLGQTAGSRLLPVRVDEQVVTTVTARVDGRSFGTVEARFVAPEGPFLLEVNPSEEVSVGASGRELLIEDVVPLGRPVNITVQQEGQPVADAQIALFARLEHVHGDEAREPAAAARSDAEGRAVLEPPRTGTWFIAWMDEEGPVQVRELLVTDPANQLTAQIIVEHLSIQPERPGAGDQAAASVTLRNVGGVAGRATFPVSLGNLALPEVQVDLEPGRRTTVEVPFAGPGVIEELRVGGEALVVRPGVDEPPPPVSSGTGAAAIQQQVADEVLGDARRTLLYLAGTALAGSTAIVLLATERSLGGRRHVLSTLGALGLDAPAVQRRAAAEAAVLAAVAFAAACVVVGLLAWVPTWIQWPLVFGHVLPNPVSWLFALQGAALFAAAAALAAYRSVGRLLSSSDVDEALPPLPLETALAQDGRPPQPGPEAPRHPGEQP